MDLGSLGRLFYAPGPLWALSYLFLQQLPGRAESPGVVKTSPLLVVGLGEPSPPGGPGPSVCSPAWPQGPPIRAP